MRWRVSAFLLVSFVVGFFSVPSSAETITLPTPYYTNQFTTVESWVQLDTVPGVVLDPNDAYDFAQDLIYSGNSLLYDINQLLWICYLIRDRADQLVDDLDNELPWPAMSQEFDDAYDEITQRARYDLQDLYFNSFWPMYRQATNEVQTVIDIGTELRSLPYTNVVTAVSFGQDYGYTQAGLCHCPDYTVYLQGLQTELQDFHDFLYDVLYWIEDFRQGWLSKISTDYSSGAIAAETLLKFWDWPFSVSVTNIVDWIDAINSNDVSIRVYNDEYNPLWVDFTNSLSVSIDAISGDVSFRGEFAVTNFFDMFDVLTNAYTVTNETRNQQDLDFANEQLQGLDEMEEDDLEIHQESYTTVQQLGVTIRGVYDDYASIFDSIPSEMPSDIVIHQGWTLGGITVTSLHWQPGDNSGVARCLNFIRTLMRSIWFFFTVVVVFHCVGIDVYVAGLLAVVVYGALFSKPEVIAKGFRFFWKIASGILGRNKE